MELLSAPEYPQGASRFSLEFRVADPEGVHQLIVFLTSGDLSLAAGYHEVRACRSLDDQTEATVEIEFDDPTPSYFVTRGARKIHVQIVGSDGDVRNVTYDFVETSPYKIATLQGHEYRVEDVVFSPDGSTLVAAATIGGLKWWDVESRSPVDSLGGIGSRLRGLLPGRFPAARPGRVPAWPWCTTWRRTGRPSSTGTTTSSRRSHSRPMAPFWRSEQETARSRCGTWGPCGTWDPHRAVASMEGHTEALRYLSFTADGTLLASLEQWGGPVRLWNVATGAPSATAGLPEGQRFSAMAPAPDTTILALTSHDDGRVRLWDVVSGVPATTRVRRPVQRSSGSHVLSGRPDPGLRVVRRQHDSDVGLVHRRGNRVARRRPGSFRGLLPRWPPAGRRRR